MRPGGAPGGADCGDDLALFDAVADVHVDAREVEKLELTPAP